MLTVCASGISIQFIDSQGTMMNYSTMIASIRLRGAYYFIATLLISVFSLPLAFADDDAGFYLETVNRGTGLNGEAPQDELSKTYLAHGKMKVASTDPQGTDMILDPINGLMTLLNHATKEYYQINVTSLKESMSQPNMEQMKAVMAETKISVTDTGETRKIGEWNCKKYLIRKTGMMTVEQETWTTEDVNIDVNRFNDMMSASGPDGLLAGSAAGQAQQDELAKVKGFPILTKSKMQMMGSEIITESEVKLIRKEAIAATQFDIPSDYTEKQMNSDQGAEISNDVEDADGAEQGNVPSTEPADVPATGTQK